MRLTGSRESNAIDSAQFGTTVACHRQRRRLLGRQSRCAFLLARDGQIDVLTLEYLAELTMAILSHLRSKDPQCRLCDRLSRAGRAAGSDLDRERGTAHRHQRGGAESAVVRPALRRDPRDRPAWRTRRSELSRATTCSGSIPEWIAQGIDLSHLETGAPISSVASRLVAANVYLGARPIAEALAVRCAVRGDRPGCRCLA